MNRTSLDQKALEVAREIMSMPITSINDTQCVARIQVAITNAMIWMAKQQHAADVHVAPSMTMMQAMTISVTEATKHKRLAEKAILEILKNFELQTNLHVSEVGLESVRMIEERNNRQIIDVNLEVRLT